LINKNIAEDYIVFIEDITGISKKFKRYFYQLGTVFCLFTTSQVKHEVILDKFSIITLPLLSRQETISLIHTLIDIEAFSSERALLEFYDLVYSRTQGFPRGIVEICEKAKRNHYSLLSLRSDNYSNPANTKSIALLLVLIVFIMFAFVMKFSINGFATTAIIYISLIVGRMLLFKRGR
jgi:hypothetical protein